MPTSPGSWFGRTSTGTVTRSPQPPARRLPFSWGKTATACSGSERLGEAAGSRPLALTHRQQSPRSTGEVLLLQLSFVDDDHLASAVFVIRHRVKLQRAESGG